MCDPRNQPSLGICSLPPARTHKPNGPHSLTLHLGGGCPLLRCDRNSTNQRDLAIRTYAMSLLLPRFDPSFHTHADIRSFDTGSALVDLYHSTNGPTWTHSEKWLTDSDACTWWGVICTNNAVTMLYLSSNNLTGSIPDSIRQLSNINELYLLYNAISGTLPSGLGYLSRMTRFYLDGNRVRASDPPLMSHTYV